MCIQIAQHIRRYIHRENKGEKTPFLPFMKKKRFFHDATSKARTNCKNSTFFEDLNFLNIRSHLNGKLDFLSSGRKFWIIFLSSNFKSAANVFLILFYNESFLCYVCKFFGKTNISDVLIRTSIFNVSESKKC